MGKKVKKKAKAINAWAVLVGQDRDTISPNFLWKTKKGAKTWAQQFGYAKYPNILRVLVIEDTPANRKRLGVKP